jgi:hypothetical protein
LLQGWYCSQTINLGTTKKPKIKQMSLEDGIANFESLLFYCGMESIYQFAGFKNQYSAESQYQQL